MRATGQRFTLFRTITIRKSLLSHTPPRAVFLSYASQDTDAAHRIADALRAGGVEVWLDTTELRGGDVWDQKIRRQIKECALFLPVISATTQGRDEGYFRREWRMAAERTHDMAAHTTFLMPVVIDGTTNREAEVPEEFRKVQWTRMPGGEAAPAFVARVRDLLAEKAARSAPGPSATVPAPMAAAPPSPAPGVAGKRRPWLLLAFGVSASLAIAFLGWERFRAVPPATPVPPSTRVAVNTQIAPNTALASERSVAVLPFVNESSDKEQEYFVDGLTDEMINLLGNVPDLRVPSRRSSFYFKGKNEKPSAVAKELNVTHLLDGTVRRSGRRLRITAQLVRADNGYQLWSQSYDRDAGDIFKIQDEIASAVVTALKLKLARLTPNDLVRGTSNVEAYDQFLLAWSWMQESTKVGFQRAIAATRKALLLDPAYADAQARLAIAQAFLSAETGDRALLAQGVVDADKAVAMGPDRWLVYIVRSSIHFLFLWDFAGAKPDIDRALALYPQNAFALSVKGSMLGCLGNFREALDLSRKAAALDPFNQLVINNLAQMQAAVGDYRSAIDTTQRALKIDPNSQDALVLSAAAQISAGQFAEARKTCDVLTQRSDQLVCLAGAERALGHGAAAKRALDELIAVGGDSRAYEIALLHWLSGDANQAFVWLGKAYDNHSRTLIQILYERGWDGLHHDPRWAALLGKMNLPTEAML